jgi:hypothetical protein
MEQDRRQRDITPFPGTDGITRTRAEVLPGSAEPTHERRPKRKFGDGSETKRLKLLANQKKERPLAKPRVRRVVGGGFANEKRERPEAKPIVPRDVDGELCYHSILVTHSERDQPYMLAQDIQKGEGRFEPAPGIVVIRKCERQVFAVHHPNLLNILEVFKFGDTKFTVSDRPGVPLSDMAMCAMLSIENIKTISVEVT